VVYTQSPKDAGGVVLGSVHVPDVGLRALQGSAVVSTDSGSNDAAAVCFARYAATVASSSATLRTANGNTGDLVVGPFTELAIDINLTSNQGTSPTIQFLVDRKGADGTYYAIYTGSTVSSAPNTQIISIGAGCTTNASFGSVARLRWVIGGSSTPGYTFSYSIIGK
jgi:hypothetical protein